VKSSHYRWYHLHECGWVLEPARRVFIKEHLKQNNDWLGEIFELLEG